MEPIAEKPSMPDVRINTAPYMLTYDAWKNIIRCPASYWAFLVDHSEGLDDFVALLAKDKAVQKMINRLGFSTNNQAMRSRLRKCLILLHAAIQSDNIFALYEISQIDTITAVLPLTDNAIPKEMVEDSDMGVSILYAIVEHLALNIFPQNSRYGMEVILGQLRLPYHIHRILINQFVQTGLAEYSVTIH